ncbi:hypothetical protein XA68_13514 [Ophiocordyceps unilateralis]|uniref:Protein transport protein Sec61 subunit beta n=1 Tax=Ophiocordyceps unilateralis TaxID=268505 RepID=A0A2A9PNH9_OPHUN|nr:hypothetical protein XA68_13514 [Ophiocordyceps unilateralis]
MLRLAKARERMALRRDPGGGYSNSVNVAAADQHFAGRRTLLRWRLHASLRLPASPHLVDHEIRPGLFQKKAKSGSSTVTMSSSRPSSPANSPATASGVSSGRHSSPTPPGGARTAIRRRAAADQKEKIANARPTSTRAAGAGGSSSTMLRLYTDESPGLKVDPVIVLVLSLVFIFSVVALHIIAKITRRFSS